MLLLKDGENTFNLADNANYFFRLQNVSEETKSRFVDVPYAHGSSETGDKTLAEKKIVLEGTIVGNTAEDLDDKISALKSFIYNTENDIKLFYLANRYYNVKTFTSSPAKPVKQTNGRASDFTINCTCADPFKYDFVDAYILRCGESQFWLEGFDAIYPTDGAGNRGRANHRLDGMFGSYAMAVENSTINLLSANQASVETDTTGFTSISSTLTKDSTVSMHRNNSLKVATSDLTANEGFYTTGISASASTSYTGSCYIKGPAGVVVKIYLRDNTNSAEGTRVEHTLTGGWDRIHAHITIGGSLSTDLRLYVITKSQGDIDFYCDALQIETGLYATSFSYLVNLYGLAYYDCLAGCVASQEMTLSFNFQPNENWGIYTSSIISTRASSSGGGFHLSVDGAGLHWDVYEANGTPKQYTYDFWSASDPAFSGNNIVNFTIYISATTARLYINGVLLRTETPSVAFVIVDENMQLGYSSNIPKGIFNNLVLFWNDQTENISAWLGNNFNAYFPRKGWCVAFHEARNADTTATNLTAANNGSRPTFPLIDFAALENCYPLELKNMSDGNDMFVYSDFYLVNGQTAEINCINATASRGTENTIQYLDGKPLRLLSGANTLAYKGPDCDLSVKFQTRAI